ncbi:MAG: deoxyuridine 5'-triphosphate nucleotidohydrolase [Chloroflexota bacterium]
MGKETSGAALGRETLQEMLSATPPLVADMVDAAAQLQPNGIDLTVRGVARYASAGRIGAAADDRALSELSPLELSQAGYWELAPGPYLVTYNEVVSLPRDVMALGRPRSSLGRCGVSVHTAVWDAGYSGRSQSLLVVYNPAGFRLERNARVMQLVFFRLDRPVGQGYAGAYQGENK